MGREALAILEAGAYIAPSGRRVEFGEAIEAAVRGTVEIPPDAELLIPAGGERFETAIRVVNSTSLAAARAIAEAGALPLVLNFASAKHPGGGFLSGARAQEESLARASALYACLKGREMYAHHLSRSDPLYTAWMIGSPSVPVFRDDETESLLESPYRASFLTAAAPNKKVLVERAPERNTPVDRVMEARVARALRAAASLGHRRLVLGAWGCGVFGNDPAVVAGAFARELRGAFEGRFEEIVFAVLDRWEDRRTIAPFEAAFATRWGYPAPPSTPGR
jgi:uncharacterized protein (TIGR02452 family)